MTSHFPHVFSPFPLGRKQVRNRLVALPAGTSMVERGIPTAGDTEHFARLAAGGVGLIITGATVVHPSSALRNGILVEAYRDEVVGPTAHKAAAVHRHGALIVGQLIHLGREFIGAESDYAPVAPSRLKTPRDAYPPHVLTVAEIDDIVAGFRRSTENLVKAGLDGVELHAAHGYLAGQFLSAATNRRTDGFGGSLEGRMRFVTLVVEAMRAAGGPDFVVGVRLSAEEEIPGGLDIDDTCRIAERLAGSGIVDYLSITHGTRGKYVKDSTNPDGVAIESAGRVRRASGLPVIVGQRIRDVHLAEQAISRGHADLVGMARALFADPELPNKSRAGRVDEIRSCLGINQDCRAFDPHLHCAVNAEVGRPIPSTVGTRVAQPLEVYVIGGGVAGMEAARVAAGRGHRVSLFERATELGGTVRVAAASPFRAAIGDIADYLTRELKRLKVDVNVGVEIGDDDLPELTRVADHLVLATGSRPALPPDGLAALTVDEVLLGSCVRSPALDAVLAGTPGAALVFDDGDGFWPAFSAAEKLAMTGWSVTVATAANGVAARVPQESSGPLLTRLGSHGVRFQPMHQAEPARDGVRLTPVFGGEPVTLHPDLVVWHSSRVPVDQLAGPARSSGGCEVSVIGDCVTPRRIGHAIFDGYQLGARV